MQLVGKVTLYRGITHRRNELTTVVPLLSGHPRENSNWPFNRVSSEISISRSQWAHGIRRGRNVTLFEYKHAWRLVTTVCLNVFISRHLLFRTLICHQLFQNKAKLRVFKNS